MTSPSANPLSYALRLGALPEAIPWRIAFPPGRPIYKRIALFLSPPFNGFVPGSIEVAGRLTTLLFYSRQGFVVGRVPLDKFASDPDFKTAVRDVTRAEPWFEAAHLRFLESAFELLGADPQTPLRARMGDRVRGGTDNRPLPHARLFDYEKFAPGEGTP